MAFALVVNRQRQPLLEESAAFSHVAERFRRAGDHRRAASLCRDGLRRFPEHVSARVTLGLALVDLGEFDQAREELRQALKRAPDNLAAIRGLAHLHDHGGDDHMQSDWEPQAPTPEFIEPVDAIAPVERIEAVERIEPVERIEATEPEGPVVPVVPAAPVFRDPELQHYFNALPYAAPPRVEPAGFEIEAAMAAMNLPDMSDPAIVVAEPTERRPPADFFNFDGLAEGLDGALLPSMNA